MKCVVHDQPPTVVFFVAWIGTVVVLGFSFWNVCMATAKPASHIIPFMHTHTYIYIHITAQLHCGPGASANDDNVESGEP